MDATHGRRSPVARIPFLCLLPVLVSGCEGDRFSEREFWRGDGASDATAALSRGDSQFVLFALPGDRDTVFRININLELDLERDLRTVSAGALNMDGAYLVQHRDSIYGYLDLYNARMLDARFEEATR
jgi:hypothetical protein